MDHIPLIIVASLLMLPGLIGIILPVLPGLPYMLIVALGFGVIDQFIHLNGSEITVLTILVIISLIIDYFSGTIAARIGGASTKAATAGFLGMIAGTLLLPPVGGFIGIFLAVVYVEIRYGNKNRAMQAATASLLGSILGIGINLLLGIAFIILFATMAIR